MEQNIPVQANVPVENAGKMEIRQLWWWWFNTVEEVVVAAAVVVELAAVV